MIRNSMLFRLALFLGTLSFSLLAVASETARSGCTAANGSLFNLEPRTNAVVQVARSVAFLPNRAGQNNFDLVVATATDARGLPQNPNPTLTAADGFYVQRANSNCAADFEGGEPSIANGGDFQAFGSPTVVADPARDAFFMVDLRFNQNTNELGIGIMRSSASTLLNSTACPNGTQGNVTTCWPTSAVTNTNAGNLNAFLLDPQLAVDPQTSGTGAGDVYTVVTQSNPNDGSTHIFLTACTNKLACGKSVQISSTDTAAGFSWAQVRPDGSITISYANTISSTTEQIKFVNCTPNGAPKLPTCSAPVLVTTEHNFAASVLGTLIGDVNMNTVLFPKHVHRLEADGKTVTTFLVYDRCEVAAIPGNAAVCPKSDVVLISSHDGGITWSPIAKVSGSKGQQFFGAIANDDSTSTVNIAYYSTENDRFQQRPQIFLAQILPGTTSIGGIHQLTTAFADVQASPPLSFNQQPVAFGNRIGIAASGTGNPGQSHAYVSYTWNSVAGVYSGASSPDVNNHLAVFQY